MLRTGRRLVWIASGKAEGRSHIFRGAGLETITSRSVSLEVLGWWSLRFIRFSTTVCRTPRDAAMDRGRVSLVNCTFVDGQEERGKVYENALKLNCTGVTQKSCPVNAHKKSSVKFVIFVIVMLFQFWLHFNIKYLTEQFLPQGWLWTYPLKSRVGNFKVPHKR